MPVDPWTYSLSWKVVLCMLGTTLGKVSLGTPCSKQDAKAQQASSSKAEGMAVLEAVRPAVRPARLGSADLSVDGE